MELQHETPGHSNGALPRGKLGTIDEVQLPEKVAEKEANCFDVSMSSQSKYLGTKTKYLLQKLPVF